jgi:hypothetical protein
MDKKMNSDLNFYISAFVLGLVLVQTLFHFRKSTRKAVVSGTSKAIAWTLDRFNRVLHVMLMSPVKNRSNTNKNGQE